MRTALAAFFAFAMLGPAPAAAQEFADPIPGAVIVGDRYWQDGLWYQAYVDRRPDRLPNGQTATTVFIYGYASERSREVLEAWALVTVVDCVARIWMIERTIYFSDPNTSRVIDMEDDVWVDGSRDDLTSLTCALADRLQR